RDVEAAAGGNDARGGSLRLRVYFVFARRLGRALGPPQCRDRPVSRYWRRAWRARRGATRRGRALRARTPLAEAQIPTVHLPPLSVRPGGVDVGEGERLACRTGRPEGRRGRERRP